MCQLRPERLNFWTWVWAAQTSFLAVFNYDQVQLDKILEELFVTNIIEEAWSVIKKASVVPLRQAAKSPRQFCRGLHAAEHALIAVAPLMVMCDRWDVGGFSIAKESGGSPAIFIYDGFPGGVGITERLYRNFDEHVGRAVELVKGVQVQGRLPQMHNVTQVRE